MATKPIIPCLGIKAGLKVKGVQFEYLEDAGDPVSVLQARLNGRERHSSTS